MTDELKKIDEQLNAVKKTYKSFLEECRTLHELSDILDSETDLELKFVISKLAMLVAIDVRELMTDTSSEIDFANIKQASEAD